MASFSDDVDFGLAHFDQCATFAFARFHGPIRFYKTQFMDVPEVEAGPTEDVCFPRPGERNLSSYQPRTSSVYILRHFEHRVLGCAVALGRKRQKDGLEEALLFPENVPTNVKRRPEEEQSNYTLVAELYQQLKKNYDDKRDYWTAGDFHYGEMEMKRLATPQPNLLSRWIAGKIEKTLVSEKPKLSGSLGQAQRVFGT